MEEKCNINTDYVCHIGGLKRCPIIENLFKCRVIWNTAVIQNFLTGRSWQTVQTQIPGQTAPLGSLIRVYTVCHTICIFWMHYSMVKPSCSNFRMIKPHFSGVRIFRVVTILWTTVQNLEHSDTPKMVSYEPWHDKTCLREISTRPDTNRPAQPQNLARILTFRL